MVEYADEDGKFCMYDVDDVPITMNLDCGLSLSHFWLPLINPP